MARAYAYVVGLLVVGAVIWPVWRQPRLDSFPLSTYPMFSTRRAHPQLARALGVDAAGRRVALPPQVVANDEVMQAAAMLHRALRARPQGRQRFCREVAARAAKQKTLAHLVAIEFVRQRYDPIRYFSQGPVPELRRVVTHCPIVR